MEDKFKNVLNDDEKITKVTTTNNVYSFKRTLPFIILTVIITILFGGLAIGLSYEGFPWIVSIILIVLFIIITIVFYSMFKKGQKNYYVCLTNKRIIIRYGIFTNNFNYYSIENVSGNITTVCKQSIFDKENENNCAIYCNIELLPVGHGQLMIFTSNLVDGYNFSKLLEKVVKENSKSKNLKDIKE